MTDDQEKAIKALEAALRKAARAGINVKYAYTYEQKGYGTVNERGNNA